MQRRNLMKQIFTKKELEEYKNGTNIKKKLLMCVIENWDIKFLERVVSFEEMEKLNGVTYLDDKLIAEWFEYKYQNVVAWHSRKRKILKHGLYNTPACYVFHLWSTMQMLDELAPLFGKKRKFKTDIKTCRKCILFSTCKKYH